MDKRACVSGMGIALLLLTAGCGEAGGSDGKISMPSSSGSLEGKNFEDVIAGLENAGFENVEAEPLGNLITGWMNDEGSVDEVEVDGSTSFSSDNRYPPDVEIVVSYHSFPVEEPQDEADAATSDSPSSEPSESHEIGIEKEPLTIENNDEFAELLLDTNPDAEALKEFSQKNQGRAVEFDGNIAYMNKHGDFDTRYDVLVYGGDYSETSTSGPNFQFRDVNMFDLNLKGEDVPDFVGAGDNFHFIATVGEYVEVQNLVLLDPISSELR